MIALHVLSVVLTAVSTGAVVVALAYIIIRAFEELDHV